MALDADVRRLAGVRPFDSLPREAVQLIAFSCERVRLKAGATVFRSGDPAEGAFFVLSGTVVLRASGRNRRAPAGVLIGEMALLTATQRPAHATADSDVELLYIPRATFHRLLAEFPEGAAAVRRGALRRTVELIEELAEIHRRGFGEREEA